MDCGHFAEILADFQEGTLSPGEQSAAQAHLAECSLCQRLLEIARGEVDLFSQAQHEELARFILDRTSGSGCVRVESTLWDFIEGDLGAEDSHLISLHLEHCAECRSVAEDLVLMRQELPAMADIDPGESFTRDVVCATKRLRPYKSDLNSGFRAWWDRMVQRPRFALEAAYVGTLVLFLTFSIASLSPQSISFDRISSARVQPPVKFISSIWTGTKSHASNQLSEFASAAAAKKQAVSESLTRLAEGCESKSESVIDRSVKGIKEWRRDQSIAWLMVWKSVSSWIPLAKL